MKNNELQVNGWAGYPINIPDRTLDQTSKGLHLGILKQNKHIWKREKNIICVVLFKYLFHFKPPWEDRKMWWAGLDFCLSSSQKHSVETGDI